MTLSSLKMTLFLPQVCRLSVVGHNCVCMAFTNGLVWLFLWLSLCVFTCLHFFGWMSYVEGLIPIVCHEC